MVYNLMTCEGNGWDMSILSLCSQCWITFAVVLFLCFILRRQTSDGFLAGTGYNVPAAFIFGLGLNLLVTSLLGDPRWSLLAGLIGIAAGGFGIGLIAPSDNEGGYE